MTTYLKRTFTFISVFLLIGCIPVYQYKAPADAPSATLTRNTDSIDKGITFSIDDDGECPVLGYVTDDSVRSVSIPAEKRVWVQMGYSTAGTPPIGYECIIKVSFIPERNGHYLSDYQTSRNGCNLSLYKFTENGEKIPENSVVKERYVKCLAS